MAAARRLLQSLWLSSVCGVSALPGRFHRVTRQINAAAEDDAPTVDLGYAAYRGIRLEDAGVDEYLGMRYAQAPLGDLRFRAPQDPLPETEIQDATTVSKDHPPSPLSTFDIYVPVTIYKPRLDNQQQLTFLPSLVTTVECLLRRCQRRRLRSHHLRRLPLCQRLHPVQRDGRLKVARVGIHPRRRVRCHPRLVQRDGGDPKVGWEHCLCQLQLSRRRVRVLGERAGEGGWGSERRLAGPAEVVGLGSDIYREGEKSFPFLVFPQKPCPGAGSLTRSNSLEATLPTSSSTAPLQDLAQWLTT